MFQYQLPQTIERLRWHTFFVAFSLSVLQLTTGLADDIGQSQPASIIARIETFGLRSVSRDDVIHAAGLKVGDKLGNFVGDDIDVDEIIRPIESVHGVEKATFTAVYGRLLEDDALGVVVYIGIEEQEVQGLEFRKEPTEASLLPIEINTASNRVQLAFEKAVSKGDFQEDSSMGYSLAKDTELRNAQEAFVPLAEEHWEQLVEVLHSSQDAKQRAIAAQVIAYAGDKKQVVQELITAVRDPDAEVRNNSTRALSLIFMFAKEHPELSITAPPELVQTLVSMLNSSEWLDRNKATGLLLSLDENQAVLRALREQSISDLKEMSNWKTGHGMMAFMLLGRLAGMTHEESIETWNKGNQSSIISRVEKLTAKNSLSVTD